MARKAKTSSEAEVKVAENAPEVVTKQVHMFEWGDLNIACKCGANQIISKGIQNGLQLILQTREDSFIQLHCDTCGADLKLHFVEGVKPPEPTVIEETKDESIQEENKQEQSL